jgi:hypothetical protein
MRNALLTAIIVTLSLCAKAQDESSFADKAVNFPSRLLSHINKKTKDLDEQLDRQTEAYLHRLAKKEAKLKAKLMKADSSKAAALFGTDPEQQYASFIQKMQSQGTADVHSMGPQYLPYADSLTSSLSFLSKNPSVLYETKILPADIQNSLDGVKQLQAKLLNADAIKAYIQQRKEQIRQYLSGEATMPPGATGIYNSYDKELYYYGQQVRQYREMLNDHDKLLNKALEILEKLPAFASFLKQNSFLAGLFTVPGNYGSPDALSGMQTRDQVLAMIQSQIGQGGSNAGAALQSSLQTAQQDIQNIQNKVSSMGAGSGSMDMPNFKPNQQKTKTLWQRLEYGINMQTQHAAWYFPTTTDMGATMGYKISDKSTIGIGASYKVGWGTSIQHINVSSQGASLRSYVDVQAKKSFYLSGGYEYNYQPWSPLTDMPQGASSWQKSGLIGISKIVSMNTKVFKKTKVQLLWDFLSYQQVPKAQPLLFRVGYTF